MSLNDRQHVEAVAIVRRLITSGDDAEAREAARIWLRENHPSPDIYLAALVDAEGGGAA